MATRILVVDDSPTIRSVVSAILGRSGYETSVATDGQDAYEILASGRKTVDLVLVDFVMPRMNGYQLCRALRANAELAAMPVVLMSAKGDRIRDQFVQQTGALDAITKPFGRQALVAVIENALRKVNTHRASSARLPDFEGDDATGAGTSDAFGALENETRRTHVTQVIGQKLASIVAQTIAAHPGIASSASLENELAARLTNEAVVDMVDAIRELGKKGEEIALLAGDLGVVPIGAVLQLLQAENQSGVLVCSNGETEIRATFRNGAIDLVQSIGAGDEFRLGRFFVEEGVVSAEEIERVLAGRAASLERAGDAPVDGKTEEIAVPASRAQTKLMPPMRQGASADALPWGERPSAPATARFPTSAIEDGTGDPADDPSPTVILSSAAIASALAAASVLVRPLGMTLLAAGKIDETQLRSALSRQSSELLYEVLRWTSGRFELRREPPSDLAESAMLAMPVASAVMEGFRRVDEWRVIERALGSFDAVLVRDDAAFGSFDVDSLPVKEKAVLDAVDGDRTVRAIVSTSGLSSFDVCRILAQLIEARALRRRSA